MTRVLLTGASGFVGSHVLQHLVDHTDWDIVCVTRGRSVSTFNTPDRITLAPCELTIASNVETLHSYGDVDYVLNVASEANPGYAMDEPVTFIKNNVAIITHVLEYAREAEVTALYHLSSDEVYGPLLGVGPAHQLDAPHRPTGPYAASKAAQEDILRGYREAFKMPAFVCNTQNVFGERQPPNKLIPTVIRNILADREIPLLVDSEGRYAGRHWIHADRVASALLFLCQNDVREDTHAVAAARTSNLAIVDTISHHLGEPARIVEVPADSGRPGHEFRTGMDGIRLRELGWGAAQFLLGAEVRRTVDWYLEQPERYAWV